MRICLISTIGIALLLASPAQAQVDSSETVVLEVRSQRQRAATRATLIIPKRKPANASWPIVYVLPVEPGVGTKWGEPLKEIRQTKLDQRWNVIWAYPTFADLPWYADHPTDPRLQQESYFLRDIIPLVEKKTGSTGERYLIGFSKSGWGAWTLTLRNADQFHGAAAFDAPMMMDAPGKYGSGPIFGGRANFARHHVGELLKQPHVKQFSDRKLVLIGRGNFWREHEQLRELLLWRDTPHTYREGPRRKHSWHSGWMAPALELMLPADLKTRSEETDPT